MRIFNVVLTLFVVFLIGCAENSTFSQKSEKELILTFDDFPCQVEEDPKVQNEINQKILNALGKHKTHGIVFVNSKPIFSDGQQDARIETLRLWLKEGHVAGNHTFSHPFLSKSSIHDYEIDIIAGEPILKKLLTEFNQELKYFRYPYLDSGKNESKKIIKKFLKSRGYEVAHVSIDSMDYLFNKRLNKGDKKARSEYIEYVTDVLKKNIEVSPKFWGKHIMLFHVNKMTADCLDEIITIAENIGYKLSK